MLRVVDIVSLERKFATLLSKLFTGAGLSLDSISDKIVTDAFFDFMERQMPEELSQASFEALASQLFGATLVFDDELNPVVYWSGLQYMALSLNTGMPLKQVALLCPLDEMCAHFAIYHEMSGQQLIAEFSSNEAKRSVLRLLRRRASLSVRMLAELTGISEPTIKHYEKSNEGLYRASFANISALAGVLDCSMSLFLRRSRFVPFSEAMLSDERFRKLFEERLSEILGKALAEVEYDAPLVRVRSQGAASLRWRYVPDRVLGCAYLQAFDLIREEQPGTLWY